MRALVTGGAGFIGRWVVRSLLEQGGEVYVLDDLSNGLKENLEEFSADKNFKDFVIGDIKNERLLEDLFARKIDLCLHLAAKINVQDSIDNPRDTFNNDVLGTFNLLELARKRGVKFVFISTCMVYDQAKAKEAIDEEYPTKPASPYAGSKLAGENLALSYYYAYNLPVVILRPFNTYGPFQKSTGEGGVVSIFIKASLEGRKLNIFGDGSQSRDLLYVEDCANFILKTALSSKVNGQILNAGFGRDITINELAQLIADDKEQIAHIRHPHPQSEIPKLLCDFSKAKRGLNWEPKVSLEEGIKRTKEWMKLKVKS